MVGAVGLVASWFLTDWAKGTEVEFMIDTGCQCNEPRGLGNNV